MISKENWSETDRELAEALEMAASDAQEVAGRYAYLSRLCPAIEGAGLVAEYQEASARLYYKARVYLWMLLEGDF